MRAWLADWAHAPRTGETVRVRVISYNLRKHAARGELEQLVATHTPNLLCLQEVDTDDLPRELVNVPEWGGDVFVRTMTGTDRDAFEASLIGKEGRMENVRARLVSLTLCNEAGERMFDDAEIAALGKKSARALDRVFSVAQRLNGIGTEQVEAAKKA